MSNITIYAHIKNNQVSVNGSIIFIDKAASFAEFLMSTYKSLGISYPKFHKMDALCKLGFLCTEFALKESAILTKIPLDKVAIVLSNAASSLETDRQHQQSINDVSNYFPSPAVFVYTLPNIVVGELAIRHKITGENAFFVSEKLDVDLLVNYTESLFNESTAAVISGWVEVDGNTYEAFIFVAECTDKLLGAKNELSESENQKNRNKNTIFKPLNQLTVTELYNQTIWTH